MRTRCRSCRETPVSMTGDLWISGAHRLLVGDATKQADVAS